MDLLNRVYLFIEDNNEYIEIQSINININEESGFICLNRSIEIECQLNENNIHQALRLLKYDQSLENSFNDRQGYLNKKDISSDVILYISKNNNNLIKIIELKNVIIKSINDFENIILLECDYYIMFHNNNEQCYENIYNKLYNINYNRTHNNQLYMPYLYWNDNSDKESEEVKENEEYDDYDWDDYDYNDDYNDENEKDNNVDDIFEKLSNLISKTFKKFYK